MSEKIGGEALENTSLQTVAMALQFLLWHKMIKHHKTGTEIRTD